MQNMVEEYRLPGGYFSTAMKDEDTAWSPLPLAIVSSVLFPGNTGSMLVKKPHSGLAAATSLPGAWVQELVMEEASATTMPIQPAPASVPSSVPAQASMSLRGDKQNDNATTKQSSTQDEDEEAAELRRTVAELRQQAEQLEQADRMVKKGLEMIAHKRVLAQHKRRRRSQWDWCDDNDDYDDDDDDEDDDDDKSTSREEENMRTLSRPKMSAVEEGEWVWIEEVKTTKTTTNHKPSGP